MSDPTRRSVRELTVEANQQILANAEAIASHWPADRTTAVYQRALLIDDLRNFKHAIKEHFESEEHSGYLSDALILAPQLQCRADALRNEHPAMLQVIDGILSVVESTSTHELAKEQDSFRRFITDLQNHEQSENALVLEAYDEDLGAGD